MGDLLLLGAYRKKDASVSSFEESDEEQRKRD
jgi:hypothetical protein